VQINQKDKPVFQGSIAPEPETYDLLATAYHFRSFNFNQLFVGQKVPYRMIIDKKVDELYFHYLGKEKVKTRNGQEYLCHKVSVYLLQGDFFPEGEYMKIWFTDDKNHLPVQVESEIMVGSVKAVLLDVRSLKYPLTSQIK
jgi:two-component SAPR family response regulator